MKRIILTILFSFIWVGNVHAAFIQTFLYRIGGNALSSGDETNIAKYDRVVLNRGHYDDIGGDSWAAIKAINPNILIYLYQLGRSTSDAKDETPYSGLNVIARYDGAVGYGSRGHTDGALYTDHWPGYFLTDSGGNRIYNTEFTTSILLRFGLGAVQDYWEEATIHDLICSDWPTSCNDARAWVADGIYMDVCSVGRSLTSALSTQYPTNDQWGTAMNSFIDSFTDALDVRGQLVSINRTYNPDNGKYDQAFWTSQWSALDAKANPPDVVFEEAAFAVRHGPSEDEVQFFPSSRWKATIDVMNSTVNSEVWVQSHSRMAPGGSGNDNDDQPVTFWDVLWYALGSYWIGKTDKSYHGIDRSNQEPWYDEYDYLDLGETIGTYYTKSVDGKTLYLRKFEKGYVIVNPQTIPDLSNVSYSTDLGITETCREITHDNMTGAWDSIGTSSSFATFAAHRTKILYFSTGLYVTSASPGHHETGVAVDKDLTWTNPTGAGTLDLYFEDANPPVAKPWDDHALATTYDPGALVADTDYYWRIDVNHTAGGTTTGTIYHFTTAGGGGGCAGDFSDGDNESFESGAGLFCTNDNNDWTETDGAGPVIDLFDTTWFNTGTHSCSMIMDSDTVGARHIEADIGAAIDELYLRWYPYISADLVNGAASDYLPRLEDAGGVHRFEVRMKGYSGTETRMRLFSVLGVETTDYFLLEPLTKYRAELHYIKNTANIGGVLKLYDSGGVQLETNDSNNTLSVGTGNYAIQYIEWRDYYANATAWTYYIDDIEMSTTDWLGPLSEGGASPTFTDLVLINDIDGLPACTTNPTASWTDATDHFIALKTSEEITNPFDANRTRLKLMTGPLTTSYTWIYYNRSLALYGLPFTSGGTYEVATGDVITGAISGATATVGIPDVTSGTWGGANAAGTFYFESQTGTFQAENLNVGGNNNVASIGADSTLGYYLVYIFDPPLDVYGDRSTDLSFENVEALDCNGGRFEDSDHNDLCDNANDDLSRADLGGTGTITLAIYYPSTDPKEFNSTNTVTVALAAGFYFLPGDHSKTIEANAIGTINLSVTHGTDGYPIKINGGGLAHPGSQTYGDWWEISRVIHDSTVLLSGDNSIHKYCIIPSGSKLQITGSSCRVENDVIKGTWDIDETTGDCYNVVVPGIVELANEKTLNCDNCYFAESEATIEISGGSVVGSDSKFSVSDFGFVDEAGGDFRIKRTSVLYQAGYDTGIDEDLTGRPTPRGVHDVGANEYYSRVVVVN